VLGTDAEALAESQDRLAGVLGVGQAQADGAAADDPAPVRREPLRGQQRWQAGGRPDWHASYITAAYIAGASPLAAQQAALPPGSR
jgi:hypothetical protein